MLYSCVSPVLQAPPDAFSISAKASHCSERLLAPVEFTNLWKKDMNLFSTTKNHKRSYLSWANSACSSMYWTNVSFCSFVTLFVFSSIFNLKIKEIHVKNINLQCVSNYLPFSGSKFSLLKILNLGDHKQLFIAYRMQNWRILEINAKR